MKKFKKVDYYMIISEARFWCCPFCNYTNKKNINHKNAVCINCGKKFQWGKNLGKSK